jgi:hypothetical protein
LGASLLPHLFILHAAGSNAWCRPSHVQANSTRHPRHRLCAFAPPCQPRRRSPPACTPARTARQDPAGAKEQQAVRMCGTGWGCGSAAAQVQRLACGGFLSSSSTAVRLASGAGGSIRTTSSNLGKRGKRSRQSARPRAATARPQATHSNKLMPGCSAAWQTCPLRCVP